jgi:membrane protein
MSAVSRSSKFLSGLVHRCSHADCFGRAGEVAFFFALAFFPLLLVAMALVSATAADAPEVRHALAMQLRYVLPGGAQLMVERTLREISRTASFGLLTTEVITALWSASAAISALQDTLNDAYGIPETRSWVVAKLNALWLTTAVCVLVIAAMLLSMKLGRFFLQGGIEDATWWNVARWPLAILFVLIAVALVYRYAPARRKQRAWAWITAGSVIAVAIWLAASFAVKAYLRHSSSFVAVYGSMTSVVALLLWFYVSALALLLGAHVNAELTSVVPNISLKDAA